MKPLRYLPHYTYSDYKIWEGNWELIQGIPYSMSPSPGKKHQSLSGKLFNIFSNSLVGLKTACKDCEVFYELDWILSDDTVLRPDIMIVCGDFNEEFLTFPPTVIVEILSPSTAIKDRTVKFDIYEQQKVNYYLIADPIAQTIKIFERTENGYVENATGTFNLNNECVLKLDLSAVFI